MLRCNFSDMAKWSWRKKMGIWVSTHPKCVEINYFTMSKKLCLNTKERCYLYSVQQIYENVMSWHSFDDLNLTIDNAW